MIENEKYESYISEDGKSLRYFKGVNEDNKPIYSTIPIGVEFTIEQAQAIIELDHRCYLDDRYYREHTDKLYQLNMSKAENEKMSCVNDLYFVDMRTPEEMLFGDENEDDPLCEIVRRVIEEECSETQQELFYKVFGMCMQLTEIRRELEALTGNAPAESSLSRSVKRIEMKVIKRLENAGIDLP